VHHNDIRDLIASILTEVCSQVIVEPELQPVGNPVEYFFTTSNTQDGARLDVAMNGFWGGQYEKCFVDVRVFNPYAASNRCSSLSAAYGKHENIKRRAYDQRIREVEHASFTLLVLSATGGYLMKPPSFTNVWLLFCPPSGGIVIPSLWAGFTATCPFLC